MSDPDGSDYTTNHHYLLSRVVKLFDADRDPVEGHRVFDGAEYTIGSEKGVIPDGADAPEEFTRLLDELADMGFIRTDSPPDTPRPDRRWEPTDAGRRRLRSSSADDG